MALPHRSFFQKLPEIFLNLFSEQSSDRANTHVCVDADTSTLSNFARKMLRMDTARMRSREKHLQPTYRSSLVGCCF